MNLVEAFTYHVRTSGPLRTTKGSPTGERVYWTVSDATLSGPEITATLAALGSDWMHVGDDGFWRPDVRASSITDDGETILMHYTGIVQQTEVFKKAAQDNKPTQWDEQYMRLMIRFEADAERYRWLNTSLFVAKGRLVGTGNIKYAVMRVT